MKHVCIDYGLVRTGLAACDPDGILAYPLETLDLNSFPNRKAFLAALALRVEQEQPDRIVVGLPLLDDGSDSLTTRQVRNFAQKLLHRTSVPVFFMPEYLSSEEASMDLEALGVRGKRKKAVLDQQAAVRILESCLSSPTSLIPVKADYVPRKDGESGPSPAEGKTSTQG